MIPKEEASPVLSRLRSWLAPAAATDELPHRTGARAARLSTIVGWVLLGALTAHRGLVLKLPP